MARYTFVVFTNAVEGQDDEFNEWYDKVHLDDVLRLGGYVAAQRFRLVPTPGTKVPPHRYLALYDVETDDLPDLQARLRKAFGTEVMPVSPALSDDRLGYYYEPIGERRTAVS